MFLSHAAKAQVTDPPLTDSTIKKTSWVNQDTILPVRIRNKRLHNLLLQGWESIHRNSSDTIIINQDEILLMQSEETFRPYTGKYIRKIDFLTLGFERSLSDTGSRSENFVVRTANFLHTDTRSWAVKQQLFFHRGDEVKPYELADNERYLRQLGFLQDARILIQPSFGYDDSVDILVVTKDVFSIQADIVDNSALHAVKVRTGERNLLGTAQELRITTVADKNRHPGFGTEVHYTNYSIGGSFVNGTLVFSNIDSGPADGLEEEISAGIALERPLYSQYAHYTGGLYVSYNESVNHYEKPDSQFAHYSYQLYDAWIGYNIGVNRLQAKDTADRSRRLIAARYFLRRYNELPDHFEDRFRSIYSDREGALVQLTLFRQSFVKTQYIYGFGVTEDLPVGYNLSFTLGCIYETQRTRPYAGFLANHFVFMSNGSFMQTFFRTGAYYYQKGVEDISLLAGTDYFSKIFVMHHHKARAHVRFSYSELFNPTLRDPLSLSNDFGLQKFNSDSAVGYRRISLMFEPQIFLRSKLLGFGMAPFIQLSGSLLWKKPEASLLHPEFYPAVGGGLRLRNENLVFNTLELRIQYFPKPVTGLNNFSIELNSDIKYRYRTSFVERPDVVYLNGDL